MAICFSWPTIILYNGYTTLTCGTLTRKQRKSLFVCLYVRRTGSVFDWYFTGENKHFVSNFVVLFQQVLNDPIGLSLSHSNVCVPVQPLYKVGILL